MVGSVPAALGVFGRPYNQYIAIDDCLGHVARAAADEPVNLPPPFWPYQKGRLLNIEVV